MSQLSQNPGPVFLVGLCCLAVALAAACCESAGADEHGPVKVTVHLSDFKEDKRDAEVTKEASVGDQLEVRLETKATGYLWQLKSADPKELKRQGEPFTEKASVPGGSEYKVYRFEVLQPGVLEFEWARPFGNRDARTAKVVIKKKS